MYYFVFYSWKSLNDFFQWFYWINIIFFYKYYFFIFSYQKEEVLKKSIPMNNSFQALKHVMRYLGVSYSSSFLEESVTAHPELDSLLAVSSTLVKYKIENFAVQLSSENLDQIPTPFVVQMNGEAHAYFSCVSDVTAEGVRLLDEKGRSELLSMAMNFC